eukprot:9853785-Lingulodinium_polyedra.AAC.1
MAIIARADMAVQRLSMYALGEIITPVASPLPNQSVNNNDNKNDSHVNDGNNNNTGDTEMAA